MTPQSLWRGIPELPTCSTSLQPFQQTQKTQQRLCEFHLVLEHSEIIDSPHGTLQQSSGTILDSSSNGQVLLNEVGLAHFIGQIDRRMSWVKEVSKRHQDLEPALLEIIESTLQ